jgi:hypothetical protein
MATTQSRNGSRSIDTAFEQARDLNEQFFAAARKAGNLYLDSYEKAVDRAADLELKFAGMTQQEWLKCLVEAQVDIAREVTSSYTAAARTLLK